MPRYIDVAKQLVRLYRLNLDCENVIKEFLITAEPEEVVKREKGQWMHKEITADFHAIGQCSVCKERRRIDNFCPNCGADMREAS